LIQSILELIELDDPVGHVIEQWDRPNGLSISIPYYSLLLQIVICYSVIIPGDLCMRFETD